MGRPIVLTGLVAAALGTDDDEAGTTEEEIRARAVMLPEVPIAELGRAASELEVLVLRADSGAADDVAEETELDTGTEVEEEAAAIINEATAAAAPGNVGLVMRAVARRERGSVAEVVDDELIILLTAEVGRGEGRTLLSTGSFESGSAGTAARPRIPAAAAAVDDAEVAVTDVGGRGTKPAFCETVVPDTAAEPPAAWCASSCI
jgi:hypothetical protein